MNNQPVIIAVDFQHGSWTRIIFAVTLVLVMLVPTSEGTGSLQGAHASVNSSSRMSLVGPTSQTLSGLKSATPAAPGPPRHVLGGDNLLHAAAQSTSTVGSWIELNRSGSPGSPVNGTQPSWYMYPGSWSIIDDPEDGYTIAFGGAIAACNTTCNVSGLLDVTWGFINGQWSTLETPAQGPLSHGSECYLWHNGVNTSQLVSCPSARIDAATTYDSTDGYVLLFGGIDNRTCLLSKCASPRLNDTWKYSAGNWTNITSTQLLTPPSISWGGGGNSPLVNDPIDGYVIFLGSCNFVSNAVFSCITFSGGHWNKVDITSNTFICPTGGSYIFPEMGSGLVEDPPDGYLLGDTVQSCNGAIYNTWYTYRGGTIGNATASTAWPSVRTYFGTVYDADLRGILLFGGCSSSTTLGLDQCPSVGSLLGDTWLYSGSKWTQLESHASGSGVDSSCYLFLNGANTSRTSPCPPSTAYPSMVYDSTDHMVLLDDWSANGVGAGSQWYGYIIENLSTPVVSTSVSVVGHRVTFSESTHTVWGNPVALRWNGLPPGCASFTTPTINCTLSAAGTYIVTVTEEWSLGVISANLTSFNVSLVVHPALSVMGGAVYPSVDVHANESFHLSIIGGLPPDTVTWRFGDGNSSTQPNTTHAYSTPGTYTATVWVNDSIGDTAKLNATIVVVPPLQATLTLSNRTPLLGQTVAIVTNASGGLTPYSFEYLGLPPGCVSINKTSIGCLPTQSGTYNISILVHDRGNATVNATKSMTVVFDFNVVIPASTPVGKQLTIMVNTNETFNGTAINKTALFFSPGGGYGAFTYGYSGLPPGCTSADVAVLTCIPTQAGKYFVTVNVHDQVGNHQTHTVLVNIVPASGGGFLGLSGNNGYYLLAGIGAAVVLGLVTVVLVMRKRRSSHRKPTREGEDIPETKGSAPSITATEGKGPADHPVVEGATLQAAPHPPSARTQDESMVVPKSEWEEMKARLKKVEENRPESESSTESERPSEKS